ncbi:MAG: glycosyltransferase family 39 protein [Myxococcota bacterium]
MLHSAIPPAESSRRRGPTLRILALLGAAAGSLGVAALSDAARASALETGRLLLWGGLGALGLALAGWSYGWLRSVSSGNAPGHPAGGSAARSSPVRPRPRDLWLLAGALLLAVGLRLPGLDRGLWYDEITTLVEFVRLPASDLLRTYTSLNNHLLYSLLAHGSIGLFGEHVWSLRLPAVAFGVAGVAAVWGVGGRIASRAEALLAALLVATSYHHVWFSQDARGYTGLMFFAMLGTWIFLAALQRRSPGLWLGYAIVLALAMYTHLSAVFVFATHALIWVALGLRERQIGDTRFAGAASLWPLAGFALGALLVFDLYALLLPQIVAEFAAKAGVESVEPGVAEWKSPLWTLLEIVRGLRGGMASWGAALAAAAVGTLGLLDFARRDRVTLALVVLPPLSTLAALLALGFHIWPRYGVVSLGFAALTVARGTFVAGTWLARSLGWPQRAARGAIAVLGVAASLASVGANYRLPKQDFEGARDWLEDQRAPGERVLTAGLAIFPYRELYAPAWTPVESAADLERVRGGSDASWLVYFSPAHLGAIYPALYREIQRRYAVSREFPGTLGGGTIYVCHSAPAPADPRPGR